MVGIGTVSGVADLGASDDSGAGVDVSAAASASRGAAADSCGVSSLGTESLLLLPAFVRSQRASPLERVDGMLFTGPASYWLR